MNTARLTDALQDTASSVYFSFGFQSMLENHILNLVNGTGAHILPIENGQALQYEGDFFGLLTSLGIPDRYHWAIMRCNGMYSPIEFRVSLTSITQPDFTLIDELQAIYSSSSGISIG